MDMIKRNWSDTSAAPISEEAIRAMHGPQGNARIYVNTYEAGTSFTTRAGHAFVLYVLAGRCKTTLDGVEVTLSAAECMNLEKGSYEFTVAGNEQLKLAKVFSLA